jgi:hypothetical protein
MKGAVCGMGNSVVMRESMKLNALHRVSQVAAMLRHAKRDAKTQQVKPTG